MNTNNNYDLLSNAFKNSNVNDNDDVFDSFFLNNTNNDDLFIKTTSTAETSTNKKNEIISELKNGKKRKSKTNGNKP